MKNFRNAAKVFPALANKKDSRVFEAMIKSVSPEGKLVVQHSIEEEFNFGEVEWFNNRD